MEGAIIATLSIILTKVIGILYVIPFYKIIGEKGGALYGYAYNIYNIFLIISSAGIPLAISKLTSEYQAKKEYRNKAIMYSISKKVIQIFSISCFLICFLFAKPLASLIIGDISGGNTIEDISFVIRCVSFALLVVPTLSISRGFLQGHNYITSSSISQVVEQLVRIAVILGGSYIAMYIFNMPLKVAVGISVFAACIGAIFAYIYLYMKMRKLKKETSIKEAATKEEKKEIIKKVISYSIPFIVVSIANNLYNTTDMILLIRGLDIIGFNAADIETISSVFTTWGNKLTSIVTSFATGLVISLIPTVVNAYTKKDDKMVNIYFNKTLQVLLFIILPITLFMSIYAKEIWGIFYNENYFGPIIFKYTILVALLDSAYIMICSALQGLYKNKLIYTAVIIGLVINALLDIPLILLFNKLGIYPYYGAITATVIGYIISLTIPLYNLYKKENFNYKDTVVKLPKIAFSATLLVLTACLLKNILPKFTGYIGTIIYLAIAGIITFGIYYALNYKIINSILLDKIKKTKK